MGGDYGYTLGHRDAAGTLQPNRNLRREHHPLMADAPAPPPVTIDPARDVAALPDPVREVVKRMADGFNERPGLRVRDFNLVHIDWLTGRAKVERLQIQ